MRYLVDTNVLLRLLQRNDPNYSTIRQAVRILTARGDELCCAPQNVVEFWNVCTRPSTSRGGFGLTLAETDRRVRLIERIFTILEETPAVYPEWRRLVVDNSVSGVQVHDARIVSMMNIHGRQQRIFNSKSMNSVWMNTLREPAHHRPRLNKKHD